MNPIKLKFQKEGVVTVGTNDPSQIINLQNPIGYPTDISINLQTREIILTIYSEDGLNAVSRVYNINMDQDSIMGFLEFFALHVRRLAKDNFSEFQNLTELAPEL